MKLSGPEAVKPCARVIYINWEGDPHGLAEKLLADDAGITAAGGCP